MYKFRFLGQWRLIPIQGREAQVTPSSLPESPDVDCYLLELLQEARWKLSVAQTRIQMQGWDKSRSRLNQKVVDALQAAAEAIDCTSDSPDE